jgi:hypothetical protein
MDIKIAPQGITNSAVPGSFKSSPKFVVATSGQSASLTSGSPTLVQMVLKLLYTRKGSVLSNPREGTSLGSLAGGSNVLDSASAALLLESSVADVEEQIKNYQSGLSRFTPSETLSSITIKSIVVGTSSVSATVVISNSLGESSLLEVGT